MGFNLTTERIQDTYQQLLQISGSSILDGTGSIAAVAITSASHAAYAITASYALNGGGGGATWPVSGTPSGLVSSSAQLADDISGSFTSTSASLASDIATNKSDIATKLATSTFTSYSSSVSTRLTTDEGNISTNASGISSLTAETSSYAVKSSNNSFSGLQTFNNVAINGTASIAYLRQVTGSAKVIGDAYIILNADTPTQRYAGVKVYDSGSSPISTGSFQWDSENNDWFYEYEKDATDYAVALFGPEFSTKGTPTYPTSNVIQKGTGGHHLTGSIMTDDGTLVTITGDGKVTNNFFAAGANTKTGNRRVALGNSNNINADDSVIIGGESNNVNASYNFAVGTSATTISGGDLSGVIGGYQHTLSGGARNITVGGEGVTNNQDYAIVLGRKSFTTPNPHTTYTANLDVSGSVVVSGSVEVTGQIYSPTFAGSIASSTSSIDFDNGNFATLSLTAGTFLSDPSNLKSGTTYTIIISSGSLISGHGTAWKFSGGTAPTYTNGTDVLTCVSDGTNLYATALTDFQ